MSASQRPHKILIANRGVCAGILADACTDLKIAFVICATQDDIDTTAYLRASPVALITSYSSVSDVVQAAITHGCDAMLPGWGFLSENPALPAACEKANIIFMGPSASVMNRMGMKAAAKQVALESGVPTLQSVVVEGVDLATDLAATRAALREEKIHFPVLLKASAGGGGRGNVMEYAVQCCLCSLVVLFACFE